jgi:D-threo-aldose 1-dehydrogenase
MDHVKLTPDGPLVSRLALGTAPIGDLYGLVGESDAQATVTAAAAGGVNFFDTSPLYGFGLSELRLGAGLRASQMTGRPVISTKVGRRVPGLGEADGTPRMASTFAGGLSQSLVFDYSADGARRSLEQSLLRLGVEAVDVVLIHDVDIFTHGRDGLEQRYREAMDGAFEALRDLRAQGLVKAIGVGVNEAEIATRFIRDGDFDVVLLAGRYSLLEQPALAAFLPEAHRRKVGVMLGGVFNSGILATGPVAGARYNYAPAPPDVLDRVRRIEAVCKANGVALRDAALRFVLGHPSVKAVVIGAVGAREMSDNLAAFEAGLPARLWSDLKAERLLDAAAPVPSA